MECKARYKLINRRLASNIHGAGDSRRSKPSNNNNRYGFVLLQMVACPCHTSNNNNKNSYSKWCMRFSNTQYLVCVCVWFWMRPLHGVYIRPACGRLCVCVTCHVMASISFVMKSFHNSSDFSLCCYNNDNGQQTSHCNARKINQETANSHIAREYPRIHYEIIPLAFHKCHRKCQA